MELSLPEDVWRKIGSLMNLQHWARISGVCKTTWKLELECVDIRVSDNDRVGVHGEQRSSMLDISAKSGSIGRQSGSPLCLVLCDHQATLVVADVDPRAACPVDLQWHKG